MADPILEVISLTKYFGAITASDGLSFSVKRGTIHALIGPNGAGKSTAIAQLSGELQSDTGRVRFDGQDVTRWSVDKRARTG
ncbi:ABC transporter ATP-binding protein, partial [Rhodospirillales bacterium 47_12_T64]